VTQVIECEGAPRDLGCDQGTHCRIALNAAYRSRSRWQRARLRLLAESGACRRARLEIRRFYPQQAEMMEALARASRVPVSWLIANLQQSPTAEGCSRAPCRTMRSCGEADPKAASDPSN
jgi:hypothetical protein